MILTFNHFDSHRLHRMVISLAVSVTLSARLGVLMKLIRTALVWHFNVYQPALECHQVLSCTHQRTPTQSLDFLDVPLTFNHLSCDAILAHAIPTWQC